MAMKFDRSAIKAQQVLQIILFLFLLLAFRAWQLCYVKQEQYQAFASMPRKRVIVEKPQRGAIFDRHGIPLALNRMSYNACIYYRDLKQLPTIRWINGVKRYPRKEYISKLSQKLASILDIDSERIEDLIYAKAALFPYLPFVIQENISEKQYFVLRMLEKDWLGIHAEKGSFRFYPRGKTACDVLGYMGAINQREYFTLASEIQMLYDIAVHDELPIPPQYKNLEEVVLRLRMLKEKAYSVNDRIGKSGVEAFLEPKLRGFVGFTNYEINKKGTFLKKLSGNKAAVPGISCTLTLSAELQQYAEQLLAQAESNRRPLFPISFRSTNGHFQKEPWIRGGSIVALDPNTGEVIAMASYPRFDPNDFSSPSKDRGNNILQWLETKVISHQCGRVRSLFAEKDMKMDSFSLKQKI
jgi:cell division protein FtsI/penicillin-binding protein 2